MTIEADEQLAWKAIGAGAYEEAIRLLRPLVERNSHYALLTLGWIYETGAAGISDEDAARLCYEHAAALGNASAHYRLGRLFQGRGKESQARAAFECGAQLDDDECKSALARLNDHREEMRAAHAIEAEAYEEAVRLLRPLVERNSQYALLTLGWIYETAAAGISDEDAARLCYEHAAALGNASAHYHLGRLFQDRGKESQARAAFECGAQLDDHECKSALARLNDDREEMRAAQAFEEEAYEEAVRLLRPLADRNSAYALRALGWVCETGVVGASDKNAARLYYEHAVAAGSVSACRELGRLLSGQGEESQARAAFQIGAERGDIPCMSRIGRMMVEGRGGPVDIDTGSGWLEKAVAEGHIFAQRTLLGIQARNARSIFAMLSVRMKIAFLAIKAGREMAKDPHSDKLR